MTIISHKDCCCSVTQLAYQASLSLTISQSLPKFTSITLVMPSSHLILWHPLFLLPSIFPSIRDFSNELAVHIRWPKHWSFSFGINPSNEYSELISLKIDGFDLLAAQGTLRSLLLHHSSKTSILRHSAFFTIQQSQLYVTTGKTIALTIQNFVGRVMSLLFSTLSRFVIQGYPPKKTIASENCKIVSSQSNNSEIIKKKKLSHHHLEYNLEALSLHFFSL